MITPSLRIKVTDFLGTDFEQEVFQELMRLKEMPNLSGVNFPLYFWYDRENEMVDLKSIEPFIKYWKSSGEYLTKLILYPQYFDTQNDFIWYDIRPYGTEKYLTDSPLSYIQYYRFSYQYTDPSTGILEGLKDFHEKFLFVSRDDTTTTKRKQKRNDYEDSSSRSRTYSNKRNIQNFMFRLKMEHKDIEIVSGGCKEGADKYAKKYALEFGLKYSEFPPYHEPHNVHCVFGAYRYGKPYYKNNYHKRNEDIVNYSEKVVAFIKDDIITNGTKSTLEYCKKNNKKFVILS